MSFCQGGNIMEMEIKITAQINDSAASLNLANGFISFDIVSNDFDICSISDPHPRDGSNVYNFDRFYALEGFDGLSSCNHFNLSDDKIGIMKLHYQNYPGRIDNINIEWIRIILDNYKYIFCPDGKLIGDG